MWTKSEGKPALRTAFASIALIAAGLVAFTWGPHGDYEPIQPDERGTIQDSFVAFRYVPTGSPALAPEHEVELNDAPVLQQQPTSPTDTKVSEPDQMPDEPVPGEIPGGKFAPKELQPSDEPPNLQQPAGMQLDTQGRQKQPAGVQLDTQGQQEQPVQEDTVQNEAPREQSSGRLRSVERTVVEPVFEGTQAPETR
jgi:hypothetical protein